MGKMAIKKIKLPLSYMVHEYWVKVQTPPNTILEYVNMNIQDGNNIVGTISAYCNDGKDEMVKICLHKPVHCNHLLSMGIQVNNIVSPYTA